MDTRIFACNKNFQKGKGNHDFCMTVQFYARDNEYTSSLLHEIEHFKSKKLFEQLETAEKVKA